LEETFQPLPKAVNDLEPQHDKNPGCMTHYVFLLCLWVRRPMDTASVGTTAPVDWGSTAFRTMPLARNAVRRPMSEVRDVAASFLLKPNPSEVDTLEQQKRSGDNRAIYVPWSEAGILLTDSIRYYLLKWICWLNAVHFGSGHLRPGTEAIAGLSIDIIDIAGIET
jgi:hypothetical protein